MSGQVRICTVLCCEQPLEAIAVQHEHGLNEDACSDECTDKRGGAAGITLGPWPCPREMESTLTFMESAYLSRPDMGSDPGDRTKMRGVKQVLSW